MSRIEALRQTAPALPVADPGPAPAARKMKKHGGGSWYSDSSAPQGGFYGARRIAGDRQAARRSGDNSSSGAACPIPASAVRLYLNLGKQPGLHGRSRGRSPSRGPPAHLRVLFRRCQSLARKRGPSRRDFRRHAPRLSKTKPLTLRPRGRKGGRKAKITAAQIEHARKLIADRARDDQECRGSLRCEPGDDLQSARPVRFRRLRHDRLPRQ